MMKNRSYECPHCNFIPIIKINYQTQIKINEYKLCSFISPYTLSLIPVRHTENDADVPELIKAGQLYARQYLQNNGIKNIRFLVNRCVHSKIKNKEHLHLLIICDNVSEMPFFNKLFSITNGIIYNKHNLVKKYKQIPNSMPYENDIYFHLSNDDLSKHISSRLSYLKFLNNNKKKLTNTEYNLKYSNYYQFITLQNCNIVSSIISFGPLCS